MTATPLRPSTRAVRAAIATDTEHGAVVPPIHLSANFAFHGFGKPGTFDYTRSGNPTRSHLGDALSALEGGAGTVVTNTGMSAVTLLVQRAKPGETIVAAHDCYGGTQRLLRSLAARGLFRVVFADLTTDDGIAAIAAERPVLVWVETPSNPLLRITDIARVAEVAKSAGALTVVDNTFLSPALQQPLALGADVVLHSTTKYLNGHSDVVGGAVVANDAALAADLAWWANCLGITGAPFDAYLTLRGLRTLFARIDHHLANARAVVDLLCDHPAVERVYYPGLATHPGHDLACRQQSGFGAMVSFELQGGVAAVEKLVGALSVFTLAESLGGVESLIAHPATMTHASMDAEARAAAGVGDGLLRLSVGIESPHDLVDDLERALEAALPTSHARSRVDRNGSVAARPADDRPGALLVGAGTIGCELIEQVVAGGERVPFRICGVADRSGLIFSRDGLTRAQLDEVLTRKRGGGHVVESLDARPGTPHDLISLAARNHTCRPIVADLTADDTHDLMRDALEKSFDVVLANKVPLADTQSRYDELHDLTRRHRVRLLHEATVGAGLPVLNTLRRLRDSGDDVIAIEGCPSGTLGFIFAELGAGRPFSAALRDAIANGLTEPDPRFDLSGIDVARKALILGRIIGFRGDVDDIAVESLLTAAPARSGSADAIIEQARELDTAWEARVAAAAAAGCVLRYRIRVTPDSITVGIMRVPHGSPLASLSGTDNQFAFTTTRYRQQPLVITGPGAGPAVTAAGVFNDLAEIARLPRTERPSPTWRPSITRTLAITSPSSTPSTTLIPSTTSANT